MKLEVQMSWQAERPVKLEQVFLPLFDFCALSYMCSHVLLSLNV